MAAKTARAARRRHARRKQRFGSGPRWFRSVVGPGHKLAALIALAALLAAGALGGLAWAAGFAAVAHVLLHPQSAWVPGAVAGEAIAFGGYTFAYRELVRAEGGTQLEPPKAAALVATGFGVFLQGGGFALDREALRRSGLSDREARQRVLGLATLEYALLAPATAVAALLVLLRSPSVSSSLTLPWLIGLPVGAVLTLGALRFRDRLGRRRGWRARLRHGLDAVDLVLRMIRSPRTCWPAFVGIAAYWFGDIFCLWAALHVFAVQPPPVAQLVVGYATGYAITRRALPLGGAGIVEALLPYSLFWVGIPLANALLAVVLYRAINLWLPMIPALLSIPELRHLETSPSHATTR